MIDSEKLAAFLDGRLGPEERAQIAEQLTRSPESYEVFAEAAAIRADLAVDLDARTARQPTSSRFLEVLRARGALQRRAAGWFLWPPLAAAAVLAAVLLVPALTNGGNGPITIALLDGADLVPGRGDGSLDARLGPAWVDPGWPVVRGTPAGGAESRQAFRLGVRMADYELAADAGDLAALQRASAELVSMFGALDGGAALARDYERMTLRAQEGADPASLAGDRAVVASAADALLGESPWLALGLWTEQARLAALAGVTGFFATTGDAAKALDNIADRLERAQAGPATMTLPHIRQLQSLMTETVEAGDLPRAGETIARVIEAAAR